MIVALNTSCLIKGQPGECSNFINEVFTRIVPSQKEHTFIYIFDQPYQQALTFPANVIPVVVGPVTDTSIKKYIWFNVKIPRLLKKYKADIFISPGSCSFATRLPQCLILYDLAFLHSPASVNKKDLSFYKKNTPLCVKKAKSVIVLSEYSKSLIVTNYKSAHGRIEIANVGVNDQYKPVEIAEREEIKGRYAKGCEFFLYNGRIHSGNNLINLLKAFSAFKKRQKSSMQLLIASEAKIEDEGFIESFRLFRFKEEVKLLPVLHQDEIAKITASAYAMVYPVVCEDAGSSLMNAMRCEVPILTGSTGASREICGSAALYAKQNFEDIALKMMEIFKDEKLRRDLIEKGKLQARKFTWENTSKLVWNTVVSTMDSNDKEC